MTQIIIPHGFSEDKRAADWKAVKLIGMLLLERCPKDRKFDEDYLEEQYEPALQEFKDLSFLQYGIIYVQPDDMQQRVIDDIMRYLERKGALS